MSKVERKEYQETKIMRTVSPTRNTRSSTQNLAEFDHNLDYLLEDLQNSVSRPGSSLGNSRTLDSNRTNSLNRYTRSSKPVDYSSDDAYSYTSPDGKKRVTGFKKESYSSYKSGAPGQERGRVQNSINQLDSLLDDLQQAKNSSVFQKDSYNSTGGDPDFGTSSKRTVQRELHYGDTPRSSSRNRTLEKDSSLTRDYHYSSEGTYGDLRPIRTTSPSPSSRTSTLSKQTKVSNVHSYPMEIVQTTTPDINPEVLAHLDPNLHPPGNTKVTTTIKTYTYEIPGSGPYSTNLVDTLDSSAEQNIYSLNTSQTTPSKSFVYQKTEDKSFEENSSLNYPSYKKPAPPGGHTLIKETVTTRNYQPGYTPVETVPTNKQTYVYNETTSTRNFDDIYPPPRREPYSEIRIYEEEHKNTIDESYHPPPRDYPPPGKTYIKEIDSSTTTNVHNGYPPNGYPPTDKTVVYKHETHTTNTHNYGPGGRPSDVETFDPKYPPGKPQEPINIQYKYMSENKTTNHYKAGHPPDDGRQIHLPKPFPTNGHQPEGPPKRLDDLMRDIGNEPPNSAYNAGFTAHEMEIVHKKKIDTLKRQQEEADELEQQKKEPLQKSKNVSGPPVYYPPGHEMFAKKEEAAANWRAQGAYERGAGKYEYESESKSQTKSKTGRAIVPVCLPLCCGLPCTIL